MSVGNMTPTTKLNPTRVALAAAGVLALAGCVATGGYTTEYEPPGPPPVVAYDDYVYYPEAEVYYSNVRHEYIYRDGTRWVTRAAPPRTWRQGTPSVHMDFHDAPEHHHDQVIRTYPRNWTPRDHRDRDHDHGRDHDHDHDRDQH